MFGMNGLLLFFFVCVHGDEIMMMILEFWNEQEALMMVVAQRQWKE